MVQIVDGGESFGARFEVKQELSEIGEIVETKLRYKNLELVNVGRSLEECLTKLRTDLDLREFKLCINRFRINAFVRRDVAPDKCVLVDGNAKTPQDNIVDSLGSAPVDEIVTAREARAAYVEYRRQLPAENFGELARRGIDAARRSTRPSRNKLTTSR